jgi:hypothetical protein
MFKLCLTWHLKILLMHYNRKNVCLIKNPNPKKPLVFDTRLKLKILKRLVKEKVKLRKKVVLSLLNLH